MRKLRFTFILIALLALCALTLVSCDSGLNAPSGLYLDVETQTLRWNMVKGAKFYTVQIEGEEKELTVKSNSVSLEKLQAGDYEIKVKANGDGEAIEDSDWSVYQFKREAESGLKYQLIHNDSEYELVGGGSAKGDVTMEAVYRGKPVTSIADKALYGNTKITGLTVGSNVKSIGDKAFAKCAALVSITIPEGVTSIGEYALQSCKALTTITLPDSVTEIAPHTFSWCSALERVKLGRNVTAIGEYAFSNCEALTAITYEGSDNSTFGVTLPATLKYIATYAFTDCLALSTVSLGAGVEHVASYAFVNCKALTKLDLGKALQTLEDFAFAYCPQLAAVAVPDSTVSLGSCVFYGDTALANVSLGKGLRSIGYYAFNETAVMKAATDMLIIDGWLLQVLNTNAEKLSINANVYGVASYAAYGLPKLIQADLKGVKYVGYAAFYNCSALYRVAFDDALLELGEYAFYSCPYLAEVKLGNSLTAIGNYAFYGCQTLATVKLPQSVVSVGTHAFRKTAAYAAIADNTTKGGVVYVDGWAVDYVPSLSSALTGYETLLMIEAGTRGIANYTFNAQTILLISIPDSVEHICRGAFYKCTTYMMTLPKALKSIGDYAFYGCGYTNFGGDAYDLTIPAGTKQIGRSAFYGCTNVLSVTVPSSVTSIGPYAFYGCAAIGASAEIQRDTGKKDEEGNTVLETVLATGYISLSEGLLSIGERAFQGCAALTDIKIPNSVTSLGTRAFYKCESLANVTIGSGITEISDYMFYKCTALESITVSDQLQSIGNYAFRGCTALKKLDLKRVKSVGRYAFYGCTALTELLLPETLTAIGDYAFRGCTGVTAVIIPADVKEIGKHVFYGLKNTTLYCEADGIPPYWNAQFNSSYRPLFWGCELSDDNTYVVSAKAGKSSLLNPKATGGISDPTRDGYVFAGWATTQNGAVAYTSKDVETAAEGATLYAVWTEQPNDDN